MSCHAMSCVCYTRVGSCSDLLGKHCHRGGLLRLRVHGGEAGRGRRRLIQEPAQVAQVCFEGGSGRRMTIIIIIIIIIIIMAARGFGVVLLLFHHVSHVSFVSSNGRPQ